MCSGIGTILSAGSATIREVMRILAECMTVCGGDMKQRTVTMSRGAADMKICCESEKLFGNISGSDIISELAVIAFADFTDFVDIEEGMAVPKEISRIPPEKRRAVAYIKNGTGSKGAEVKLYDKMKALELLGKYFGVFDSRDDGAETLEKLDGIMAEISRSVGEDEA